MIKRRPSNTKHVKRLENKFLFGSKIISIVRDSLLVIRRNSERAYPIRIRGRLEYRVSKNRRDTNGPRENKNPRGVGQNELISMKKNLENISLKKLGSKTQMMFKYLSTLKVAD